MQNIDTYRNTNNTEKVLSDLLDRDQIPDWMEPDIDIEQLVTIVQYGCASGAYMPAVTYYAASETMHRHGNEVLAFIDDYIERPPIPEGSSWQGIAVHYLSTAVEIYAGVALDEIGIEL